MTKCILTESVHKLPKATAEGVYRVRIIEADVDGSSGYYAHDMLESYGPAAFPIGSLSHIDHASKEDLEKRPEGSLLTLGGYTVSEPIMESDGLYVDMKFGGKAKEIVQEFGDIIGLSIRAQGDVEESAGRREVKAIYPSPLNTIDLVTIPGAGGKIVKALQESIKVSEVPSADNGKASHMEIEDLAKEVASLKESLADFITTLTPIMESLKPEVKPEVDVVEAVRAAYKTAKDLPEALREEVIEAVKLDPEADVAKLVAEKVTLVESIRETITEAEGFIVGGKTAGSAVDLGKVL